MCKMCDGATIEELRAEKAERIARYGWSITAVEPAPGGTGWAYTIGLGELGHPELVLVGGDPMWAGMLLNVLGERVRLGHRFDPWTPPVDADGVTVRFGEVHPEQFATVLADWVDYYGSLVDAEPGRSTPEPRALQVVLPDGLTCDCHAHLQTCLADPEPRLGAGPGPTPRPTPPPTPRRRNRHHGHHRPHRPRPRRRPGS